MRNSSIPKNTLEIPVTEHLFEGHLYIKENDKWIWRLFRFDGSSFICLSTKKSKLPAPLELSSSVPAIPKNRTVRHTTSETSLYQLPKWIIQMNQISAISLLKPKEKSFSITSKLKCFTIRTYKGDCYIFKAYKHDDLERWIFVLSKMWKLSQLYQPTTTTSSSSFREENQAVDPYNINFFQDANTVCSEESNIRYNYQTLTYRTLSKRHKVQVVNNNLPKVYTDENVCLADVQKYLKQMNQ